ncbi:MAG: hypothetical protein VX899_14480 [Myxococcota bacterium]|nr:hypothetical protein [Myxococcota bacterium]
MIALLLACTVDTSEVTSSADTALPSVERPAAQAVWDAATTEQVLSETLAEGFPSPWRGIELYFEMLTHGDAYCPASTEFIDDQFVNGCDASTGWWYSGVSTWETGQEPVDEMTVEYAAAVGDYLVLDPDGQQFECGGHQATGVVRDSSGQAQEVFAEHKGSFWWEGDDGVYRDPVSGALNLSLRQSPDGRRMEMSGALQVLGTSTYVDGVFSESCDWQLSEGSMRVRDPSGGWITWTPEPCTSCGPIHFSDGTALGEICVDTTAMVMAQSQALELLQ